jgi:hypothetical protein
MADFNDDGNFADGNTPSLFNISIDIDEGQKFNPV